MMHEYNEVITRFLHNDERLILSHEHEMPLVLEANKNKDLTFLTNFLAQNSAKIMQDLENYGAILLRGFEISSTAQFEQAILSIDGLSGIRDVFMSEEGRVRVDDDTFVLHTNSVYKTGGTLYLGGFHSENYYAPDVPGYICFCCFQPSARGGETGLINTKRFYAELPKKLQQKLEKQSFLASKWLVSEVAERYCLTNAEVIKLCKKLKLPLVGKGKDQFILMYKPNVWINPHTQEKALQINFFEIPTLNKILRRYFMPDYPGKNWFWHRFVWRLPEWVLRCLEYIYLSIASFIHSPKDSLNIFKFKLKTHRSSKISRLERYLTRKVKTCFSAQDVDELARLMHKYYCSCLWQKGDILLVDNKQVVHAGMPGVGKRLLQVMICNPLRMRYTANAGGILECQ